MSRIRNEFTPISSNDFPLSAKSHLLTYCQTNYFATKYLSFVAKFRPNLRLTEVVSNICCYLLNMLVTSSILIFKFIVNYNLENIRRIFR